MNSRYWANIVIKILNLNNSLYNFSNNDSETDKNEVKANTLACKHVSK